MKAEPKIGETAAHFVQFGSRRGHLRRLVQRCCAGGSEKADGAWGPAGRAGRQVGSRADGPTAPLRELSFGPLLTLFYILRFAKALSFPFLRQKLGEKLTA